MKQTTMQLLSCTIILVWCIIPNLAQHRNYLHRQVKEVLECARQLREYVTNDYTSPDMFNNCSGVLYWYNVSADSKDNAILKFANSEDLYWVSALLYEYRTTLPRFKNGTDLMEMARRVYAKSRQQLQPIVAAGIGTKILILLTTAAPYSIPLVITADSVQFALESIGYESLGRSIGAVGTTIVGAMVGLWMYNKPGGAFGSMIGFFIWIEMESLKDKALQYSLLWK